MNDMQIGGMHADLAIDVREWAIGLEDAREGLADFATQVAAQFKELENKIRNVGLGLTAAISVPFAGMAVVSRRGAGAFEKSMNNVQAALRGLPVEQLDALSQAAQKLGPEVGRSAKEAADGIETLALAGMSASDILDSGLEQTLRLAAANAADLGQSAAAVTDVMAQFGKSSGDLEGVVNQITGALDASKLGFNDFKDAIAQGGGVAGAAGVTFEDFNTAIAGTAALFGSGSDAGTSFKTFITTLTPKSKEAAAMMEKLGLDFYDATGKMKDLADIAELLRAKLGNLSDRSRTQVMTEIFGTDAMRTAIGLMRLGGQAFDDLQQTIGQTDAGEKLSIQLQGVEASAGRLRNAFDQLKIALGETGILAAFTAVQDALASVTRWMAELPLGVRQVAVALWAITAAVGPMVLALLGIAKVLAPIILLRGGLGIVGTVIAGLINPVGTLIAVFGRLALAATGLSAALGVAGTMMLRFAGPIGLAVTALSLLYLWSTRTVTANAAARQAASNAAAAYEKQQAAALGLVAATGQARKAIIDKMKADRAAQLQAMATAKADVMAARAALERAKANLGKARSEVKMTARGDVISPNFMPAVRAAEQAEADLLSRAKTLETVAKTVEGYNASINTPEFGTVDINFDEGSDSSRSNRSSGPSAEELADRREQMKIEQQLAVARARDDKDEVRRLEQQLNIIQRRRDYEDAGLSTAAAQLAAQKDIADVAAAEAEFNAREYARAEDAFDLRLAELRGDEQIVRMKEDQAFLTEQTVMWQSKGLTLLEAQKRANEDLVQMDAARAAAAARLARSQALDRNAELSRLRGDTDARQRLAQRAAEINRRSLQYYRDGEGKISEEAARERATLELDEEEQARQQGQWRDTFRGAMRAAMDGDLKGFASNWWKDQVAKGMEEALNSLSDLLFNLFRQALGQAGSALGGGGGGGGGFFGTLISGIGSLFGGGGGSAAGAVINQGAISNAFAGLPKFATGGSFEIGGKPGIDTNLVQFWGTAGETVNVRRPGQTDGGGIAHIVPSPYFDVIVDQRSAKVAAPMAAAGSMQARSAAGADMARASRRRIPGR